MGYVPNNYLPGEERVVGVAGSQTIRSSSPVSGLDRAQLSFAQVLGQSVSAVAPSAVMVTLPAIVLPAAGGLVLPLFAVAALLMTGVGYCVGQFATRMVAVSGVYSYTVKGLGPLPGFGAGWSLLIGYAAAAMASVLGAASYLSALAGRVGLPHGTATVAVLALAVCAIALLLMVRGIGLSARTSLAIEVFAIAAAGAVLVVAFARSFGDGHDPPNTVTDQPHSAIGFALLLAITSFVGFESAGTVAREARNPFVAIPRAVRWTPIALGILYLFAAGLQQSDRVRDGLDSVPIVLSLSDGAGGGSTALSVVMELGVTASWFACVIGSATALSRTLFAMGREGVVPAAFGHTHSRYKTPHVALLTTMPIVAAVPIVYLLVAGSSRDVLVGLLAVSAHGYVVAYVLLCVATPTFLYRIGEPGRVPLLVGATTAVAMVGLIGWAALSGELAAGASTVVYVALLFAGGVVCALRVRRDRTVLDRIGVYDETIADDLLVDHRPWEVRR